VRKALLSLGGIGFVPGAPGTVASAAVFAAAWGASRLAPEAAVFAAGCTAAAAAFVAVTVALGPKAERETGAEDPGWIVADEAAGALVAVAPLADAAWWVWLAVFAAYRLLDGLKPFGIRRLEKIGGGWGIALDDLVAGAGALGVGAALLLGRTVWHAG